MKRSKKKEMLRIALISDTHNRHRQFKFNIPLKTVDLILHAGDISMGGRVSEVKHFMKWYGELSIKSKILIAGNHDWLFEKEPTLAKEICKEHDVIYLNDSGIELCGLKIWGSPVQPWFYDWAFNRQRGDDIKKHWDLIPNDTDILITHSPPLKIMDGVPISRYNPDRGMENVGCFDLMEAVKRVKPKIHLFGHIHEGYGVVEQDGTMFVNGSIVDGYYYPHDRPIIVDIDLETKGVTLVQYNEEDENV